MTQTPGNQPGIPVSQFDPDQLKQDILSEVQNLLNTFAQQQQPFAQQQQLPAFQGYPPLPSGFPGYPPQQQQFIPNGPVVNADPVSPTRSGATRATVWLATTTTAARTATRVSASTTDATGQYPLAPYGQQPTIEQFFQVLMGVLQRQEQLIMQMQELIARGQANPAAPVGPPYPYGQSRVEQYVWLFDWGLQYNDDGTAKPQVTYADINTRRARLDTLHQALTWNEKDTLTSRGLSHLLVRSKEVLTHSKVGSERGAP